MKTSYRILSAGLIIVAFIFAGSILSFYSLTGKIILGLAGAALLVVFMLLFLDRNTRAKNEYSRFIALINQNLSLKEMADSVLAKIISTTGLTVGRLFMIESAGPRLLSSYGLLNETSIASDKIDLYQRAIEIGEETEFHFTENFPVVRSGIAEIAIRHILIIPVKYNNQVIAVLELASVSTPKNRAREYLANIKDQLAAGLSKAYALEKLENLVQELKENKMEPRKEYNGAQPVQAKALPEIQTEEAEEEELLYVENPAQLEADLEERKNIIEKREQQTILIIDQNSENRKIISRYLSSKHYNIREAESLEKGMNEISLNMPFAVTLSLSGSISSWEVLKKLKQNEAKRSMPVILYNTVDALNFGYGLQVYDYVFGNPDENIIKTYLAKLPGVKNIVLAGFEEEPAGLTLAYLKGAKVTSLKEQNTAFKAISKLQPELVFMDAFMQKGGSILLLDRLKTSFETKDIPVVLCIKPEAVKEDLELLNSSIEKITIKSRGSRIDILKAIRDRIHLEEGMPEEDTSSILIESGPEELETADAQGVRKLHAGKVLIVDDDADTLTAVGEIITKAGCETVLAMDGVECLTKLQKLKPDLILLDIMMPHMDGFETIRRIKAEKNLKDIPVFALTSHEMIDEKEILIKNGFDDFVSKPVNSGSLSFKIEKVLNNITEPVK